MKTKPEYLKLYEHMREEITGGTWTYGERLPSRRQIARDREAMNNPEIDPNTKFEGWLHYEDNVRRQIISSYEEWMKAFCERKYNSGFSREMTRSVKEFLKQYKL